MPDLIYALFGKRIKRKLAANSYRPKGLEGLDHAYEDLDGRSYYAWPDVASMPMDRQNMIDHFMTVASGGTTEENLETLMDKANDLLQRGMVAKDKERSKLLAAVAAIHNEVKLRAKEVVPEETYFNIAAACVCREDESSAPFDQTIHTQKVEHLRKAAQAGASFFLTAPALKLLLGALHCSEQGLKQLLTSWMRQKIRTKALNEVFSLELS